MSNDIFPTRPALRPTNYAYEDTNYKAALAEIDQLWDAKKGTPDGDKLDVMVILVEAWEEEHYPIKFGCSC